MLNEPPASFPGGWSHKTRKPGEKFGGARYILKKKIGQGEWTEVWLARDVKWERDVTLKFLPTQLLENGHFLEHIDDEVRRSAQLAHPAIARVFDFVYEPQAAAIATEYVDGWPLSALKLDRPQNRFGMEEINLWTHQVCAALDYSHHEFCLVHRDLNPSNLLLNGRDQLKVTDFGIAHAIRNAAAQASDSKHRRIAYFSPQQLGGAEASVLDDIYALGATIYELSTGTPPFYQGELNNQILEAVAPRMNDRLHELGVNDLIPSAWEDTIAACLSKDPGKRPQSASEVLRGLEKTWATSQVVSPLRTRLHLRKEAIRNFASDKFRVWPRAFERFIKFRPRAEQVINAFRRNPKLLFRTILALAAINLAIALWFLFRR
jgi:serine/threonine protein kinase